MRTRNERNMTKGTPIKVILLFAIPILLGNVFQQLYNVADTAIIGNVLGDQALAAVGATAAIYGLIIGFANGMTNGFSVVLARFYGAGQKEEVKKTVALTMILTTMISIVLTLLSLLGLRPLLHFLNTPDSIITQSQRYLSIIFAFSIVTMFYNMFAGLLRAIGNSKVPLWALIVSTVINIVLDLLFVKGFSWGIGGAAYATVIAQGGSVILCILYIRHFCPLLVVKKEDICMDRKLIIELMTTGLSMGLMLAIVSVGSVALQSAVNGFGDKIIAAHTAARKIDDIFMLPLGTLSMAASTFASQNFGAGRMDRVKQGIKASILLAFIWSGISCIVVLAGGGFMARMLTGSTNSIVIETAVKYITINIPFFFVLSILLILRSSLQGVGKKLIPLTASMIELLAKFIAVGMITPVLGYFGVCIIEPIIWSVCSIIVAIDFIRFIEKAR
ncbi:multi antimicrobial extrusion protein (Na(+)/drug antiporter), MATE family of MDR efflux pumps [Lachnospiraceae bacterium KM106-2]|nr:multi antimicrobial extrusion protein (Na(+)/drug antiporter), MATE family of MDR efflux pumps [Lachnospiraceae bacterium KM106-2]